MSELSTNPVVRSPASLPNSAQLQASADSQGAPSQTAKKQPAGAALNKIRPSLQADGGDVEFVDYEDGVVKVRLQGACSGCPMSQMTLKNGIERMLKQEIPEIKSVESA